jgi:FkbM family methyltransferase
MAQSISYAQRYEDLHLLRALGEQDSGFYIDIGAGHPVYDNVSFAFYQRGWRGVTVEPNPWLAELSAAVRPCDTRIQSLVAESAGDATYYLVEDFHGFSTAVAGHAQTALSQFGKGSRAMTMPVTTLHALCEQYAPTTIDFLKIDVEGAELAVLAGGDFKRFRPKVVVAEALAPFTMAEAFAEWEPLLTDAGYRFTLFDSLNRYYVAEEHPGVVDRLSAASDTFHSVRLFRNFKPARDDASHPDHHLARLLDDIDMVRLPLMDADVLLEPLIKDLDPSDQARPAQLAEITVTHQRLFGEPPPPGWAESLGLPPCATVRDLYRSAIASDAFRFACGRISASSAW